MYIYSYLGLYVYIVNQQTGLDPNEYSVIAHLDFFVCSVFLPSKVCDTMHAGFCGPITFYLFSKGSRSLGLS